MLGICAQRTRDERRLVATCDVKAGTKKESRAAAVMHLTRQLVAQQLGDAATALKYLWAATRKENQPGFLHRPPPAMRKMD